MINVMRYGVRYLARQQRRKRRARAFLSITRLILEEVAAFGESALDAFFPAKYPEARLWRSLLGLDKAYRFKRESFISLLWRLQAQGLVERSPRSKDNAWRLTALGWSRLDGERDAKIFRPRPDGVRRLVIFDIPERQRKKRDAMRYELAATGFRQLQKSVWIGEHPLPQEFIELVEALDIRRYVNFFSIRDEGTLGGSKS